VPSPARGSRRPRWRLIAGGAALVLLLVAGIAIWRQTAGAPPPPAPTATPGPTFRSRGVIRPIAQARIGSASGGTVSGLSVREGDTVQSHQEIARVSGPSGTEVLVAPWAGTITAVPVERGASVAPGGAVATIGDLSRLRVETTDVDEYLVDQIRRGQAVMLRVDALDQRTIQGFVRSVALEPQVGTAGFEHYPVVIDLVEVPPELRVGMTARVAFELPQGDPATTPTPSP
jgi:multidrug efflux pump subunit AcrA (membrane-fusion protein)